MTALREVFIMQFAGGLYDTKTFTAPPQLDWPLPDTIYALDDKRQKVDTGKYIKTFESSSNAKTADEARGALYEWKED